MTQHRARPKKSVGENFFPWAKIFFPWAKIFFPWAKFRAERIPRRAMRAMLLLNYFL